MTKRLTHSSADLLGQLFQKSFLAHLWAVWLDTLFRFGWQIPKFPEPMDEWQGAILPSFFGIYTLGKTVQSLGTAIAMRKR